MAWTLCTSGAAIAKAGANCNTDIRASGAILAQWSNEAEGRIVEETRRNWVTQHTGLPTDVKNVLSDVCSSLIAMQMISYDMSGYTDRREAETILDVQDDRANKALTRLKDFKSNSIQNP